ncbi:WLM domain-containing protein [Cubamyces lactineus]|nr:WLM domain-containing protein [Cubamyces lactineus]
MPDIFVKSFTHLKDRPNANRALPLLQRVASLVKPIMRKHGWVLPVLSEFFPESPNLLDINAGQKILVRLRPADAPDTFFDEEDIVHTMLHELTHNVHGPHDEKFYKFLSGLEEEYEALRKSGYSGEGFHSEGRRLGTNVSHDVPPHIARQKALEAAEKRRKISVVLGGGGRLGGTIRGSKSPRELAAEAAERRAHDEKACASGALAQAEAEKAAHESVQDDVIDLTGDDSDGSQEPEIIIIDESPSPSPPSSSSTSTPGASTPMHRPTLGGQNGSGYSSSSSVTSSGSRTPASWSGLRPGSAYASSSSSLSAQSPSSTGTTTPSSISASSQQQTLRPTVRRVERGAGASTPRMPKPRSVSRPPKPASARSPATPPPTRTNSVAVTHKHLANGHAVHAANGLDVAVIPPEKEWACPRCTLINDALALQCSACLLLRPKQNVAAVPEETNVEEGWTCHVCGEQGMPRDLWTCRFCGTVKASS